MRIRSTKPEFWKSRRITSVSWDARLVLKGLESYVDDNGVGIDDIELIVTDVFPRDLFANPRETVARVSEAISELHQAGLVHRYEGPDDHLLYVSFWEEIQRIDKPGKGRNPRPDGTKEYKDSSIRESVATPRESVALGTGEQGNRGTEEQGAPLTSRTYVTESGKNLSQRERVNLGAKIVNQFHDQLPETLPTKIRNDLTAHATVSLQDGIHPAHIARGLELWNAGGYAANALPSFILGAQREANGNTPGQRPSRATGTDRAMVALELADQYREQEAQEDPHAEKRNSPTTW